MCETTENLKKHKTFKSQFFLTKPNKNLTEARKKAVEKFSS
ncbi:hypothetical protein S7335_192 [Synechococcus sp. PCC 7335]|nr:hypothetical protein S7335_192 [Synechococcus sp. PCC 7335]